MLEFKIGFRGNCFICRSYKILGQRVLVFQGFICVKLGVFVVFGLLDIVLDIFYMGKNINR